MDSEELRLRVEVALKEATRRADELAGLPPDTAPPPEQKQKPEVAAEAEAEPAPAVSPPAAAAEKAALEPRTT
jgi:hypothetical protein